MSHTNWLRAAVLPWQAEHIPRVSVEFLFSTETGNWSNESTTCLQVILALGFNTVSDSEH